MQIDIELLKYWVVKRITGLQLKLLIAIVTIGSNEKISLERFKEELAWYQDEDDDFKGYYEEDSRSNIKSYIRRSLDDLEDKGIIRSQGGSSKFGRNYKIVVPRTRIHIAGEVGKGNE